MANTQKSIDKLNKYTERLSLLNKQLEQVNKNTKEYKKLTQEKVSVEQKAIKVSKQLAAEQAKLSSTLPNHKKLIEKSNEAQKKFNKSTGNGAKETKSFGNKLKTATATLARYGIAYKLINSVQRVFTELTLGSIREAIAFEKSLANLGAVAGATNEDIKLLGKTALNVAGTTKFTANEIIGLQTELSKLGFTSEEVVASTEAIAFTAQALGAPLDAVAQQTGKVINQFGLLIEQAGFVGDVLVTSINNSALSFDSFGTAIQYVGPIAKNLGLTLEQTAGAMAVLADNGFTASRVGTGLRGIFTELGKTSADVESSLKKLANQNISLSEAVELVGKRNAAQLITLLKNIDAIEEGTGKYYEQGRALESAAKNVDNFAGQMDLLNSAFKEFQIGIGDSIAESNILLSIMDGFFPVAAKTARGFKSINEVGFESFNKGSKEVEKGANALDKSLELLGITQEEYQRSLEQLNVTEIGFLNNILPDAFNKVGNQAAAQVNKVEGFRDAIEKLAENNRTQTLITKGQTIANDEYEDSVRSLTEAFEDQLNVNKEVDDMAKRLNNQISEYGAIIKSGFKTETDVFGIRSKSIKLTDSQITTYKALRDSLKAYLDQLTNITFSEDELANKREKQQSQALNKELKRIKKSTEEAVNAANERAKVETELADTADERADIERERTLEVSGLYKKQASEIKNLGKEYDTQKEKIEQATAAAEKQAEILGSEVISDASSALKEFSSEFDKIKDDYIAGNISLEEYNDELAKTQTRYREYIEALIGSSDLSEDAIKVLRKLADAYDNVSSATEATDAEVKAADKATKDAKKTWEEFTDELKKTGWQEIAKDAVQELGDVLDEFNKTQLDNTIATEQAKLEEIRNRYSIEEQIIKSQLENQLLTESQFRQKQSDLKKAQIAEENSILKRQFDAQKKADVNNARLDGLESAAQSYLNAFQRYEPVTAAIIGSIGAAISIASASGQISAINQRKFVNRRFADGGVVNGPSHDQGGVPFTVQGQGGYEMEGGEYIVNKRSTSMYRGLLEQINSSAKPVNYSSPVKFANGGVVNNISNVSQQSNESVDYLKAIAEATTSTAIGVSKPVRAFVADKDLRTNSNERRLRDRNDRI